MIMDVSCNSLVYTSKREESVDKCAYCDVSYTDERTLTDEHTLEVCNTHEQICDERKVMLAYLDGIPSEHSHTLVEPLQDLHVLINDTIVNVVSKKTRFAYHRTERGSVRKTHSRLSSQIVVRGVGVRKLAFVDQDRTRTKERRRVTVSSFDFPR